MRLDSTIFESRHFFKALLVCLHNCFLSCDAVMSGLTVTAWESSAEDAVEVDTLESEKESHLTSHCKRLGTGGQK